MGPPLIPTAMFPTPPASQVPLAPITGHGVAPSPHDARQSLPRMSQTPMVGAGTLPVEPSPSTTNRVSTSPMMRQVPTPVRQPQGYAVPGMEGMQRVVSGGQRAPSQPPGVHGEGGPSPSVEQEALFQARLQQQHLLQRQALAAQQAQQGQAQGFSSPGMPGNPAGNGLPLGFPGNVTPASAAAFLRQQGMNPQQVLALNLFAAQQQRQQQMAATGSQPPGMGQSGMGQQPPAQQPGMGQLGMMGLNPQQQHQLANRLPPHLMAQFQQGAAGGTGMTNEQARAIMNMQQALAQQRMQQQQQQQQGQGFPNQQGMNMGAGQAGINPALMAQFLQNAGGGGMLGMGGQR